MMTHHDTFVNTSSAPAPSAERKTDILTRVDRRYFEQERALRNETLSLRSEPMGIIHRDRVLLRPAMQSVDLFGG